MLIEREVIIYATFLSVSDILCLFLAKKRRFPFVALTLITIFTAVKKE